jgi:hypothetical protein
MDRARTAVNMMAHITQTLTEPPGSWLIAPQDFCAGHPVGNPDLRNRLSVHQRHFRPKE